MNEFKPTLLLLVLRMRQIYIPLAFSEFNFLRYKSEFLQTHSMLEKSENRQPLVENDNSTFGSTLRTKPTAIISKITMKNPEVASEQVYFLLVFLIFYHIRSHSGRFENPLSCMYQWIIFSTIECGQPGLSDSISDVLAVIYSYDLLILVKNIFIIHSVGTRHCPDCLFRVVS